MSTMYLIFYAALAYIQIPIVMVLINGILMALSAIIIGFILYLITDVVNTDE